MVWRDELMGDWVKFDPDKAVLLLESDRVRLYKSAKGNYVKVANGKPGMLYPEEAAQMLNDPKLARHLTEAGQAERQALTMSLATEL